MPNDIPLRNALERAQRERETLTAKLANIKTSLQRIESFISYAEKYLADPQPDLFDNPAAIKKAASHRFSKMSMSKAAEIILLENAAPMHVDRILEELIKGGYDEPKYGSLYTSLVRRAHFYREDMPSVFGLTEWKDKEIETAPPAK